MATAYVGLDVHSKLTQLVIQDESGRVRVRGQVPTTPDGLGLLRTQYRLRKGTRVGLETGTMSNYVARQLLALGLEPVVIDAHEVRAKASRARQKSDQRDAFAVCDGLRKDQYDSIVPLPPLHIQTLRETLSRRRHFVRVQSAELNAAKHLLRYSGLRHLSRPLATEVAWKKLLAQVEDTALRLQIDFHHRVWSAAGEQIELLDASLAEQSRRFGPELRLLQTVPGVGRIVSLTVKAHFWNPGLFPSSKHAASFAGLVPSTAQSGDQDRHGHITKQGSPELRAMLCEAAHHACRKSNPLQPYFSSLCARHGYRIAVTAVAHRLCRILFAMLRDKAEFDVRKLGVEVGPFEKKIVKPYRLKRNPARRK